MCFLSFLHFLGPCCWWCYTLFVIKIDVFRYYIYSILPTKIHFKVLSIRVHILNLILWDVYSRTSIFCIYFNTLAAFDTNYIIFKNQNFVKKITEFLRILNFGPKLINHSIDMCWNYLVQIFDMCVILLVSIMFGDHFVVHNISLCSHFNLDFFPFPFINFFAYFYLVSILLILFLSPIDPFPNFAFFAPKS
jgi:hypothetical protein